MKNLQMKYNFLHLFYWITYDCVYGFVAIFLQYKGLSNTEIGIVTGLGAALTIFTSPFISGLIGKIKGMTIKKMMTFTFIAQCLLWIIMSLLKLPDILMIILYMLLIILIAADVPLLSQICMEYLKGGEYLNFGVSRGIGSVSYASSAVVMGWFVDLWNPLVIGVVHIISTVLFLILLNSLPDIQKVESEDKEASISMPSFILKYKKYFLILLSFTFAMAAQTALATYLINIVKDLGGTNSIFGIATFAMAASEMPFMAITHTLLKKFKPMQLFLTASLVYIVRNVLISIAPNLAILIIGLLFEGASYGIMTAVITNYANDYIDKKYGMVAQTLIAVMTTGVGSTVGNYVGGLLQDTLGLTSMKIFAVVLTFIGTAIMIFVYIKFGKNENRQEAI